MKSPPKNLRFEDAMERLEAIVEAMEGGQIGIEDTIGKFEEAMVLHAHCRKILDDAELRIQKIQVNAAGQPMASPVDPPLSTDDASDEPS